MKLGTKIQRCKCGRLMSTKRVCNRCTMWAGIWLAIAAKNEIVTKENQETKAPTIEAKRLIKNML